MTSRHRPPTLSRALAIAMLSACTLLAGCAAQAPAKTTLYDLGMLPAEPAPAAAHPAPVSIADVQAPGWLDNRTMFYRLGYENGQEPRAYASSRWAMPPSQMFGQRLKSRIAQSGGVALPASDGAANVPVLRIEADEFMQVFDAPDQSYVQIRLRAALFQGRTLIAQKMFSERVAAPTADAAGGARAMAQASDAVITDMIAWLQLSAPKPGTPALRSGSAR